MDLVAIYSVLNHSYIPNIHNLAVFQLKIGYIATAAKTAMLKNNPHECPHHVLFDGACVVTTFVFHLMCYFYTARAI